MYLVKVMQWKRLNKHVIHYDNKIDDDDDSLFIDNNELTFESNESSDDKCTFESNESYDDENYGKN